MPHRAESLAVPAYLLFPLLAAVVYSLGSILIKRALKEGVTMTQSFHLTNFVMGAVFVPLILFERSDIAWHELWRPCAMGVVFFLGTWLTFVGIRMGDVSLVTPIMGTKVVFVALGAALLTGQVASLALWIAASLTATGIFVMGWGDVKGGKSVLFTILVTLASAALFGLCDVFVNAWSAKFGAMTFLTLSALGISLGSLVMWFCQGRPVLRLQKEAAPWAWGGAFAIGLQALCMGLTLSFADEATAINVVYASRGLWVIVLVVAFGAALGNREHKKQGLAFLWRVAGTLMVTAAIVIAVVDRAKAA